MSSPQFFVLLFFAGDLGLVLLGLYFVHRQRCIDDITDMRYRNHPDRMRRTIGR